MANTLYFADNLDILRRYVKDETVDLVCLDPSFNGVQDYDEWSATGFQRSGTAF